MRDRRRRGPFASWNSFFWFTLLFVFFSSFTFSTLRLFLKGFRPKLLSSWRTAAMEAISGDPPVTPSMSVRETVQFPDQVLLFLKYPSTTRLFTKDGIDCIYSSPNSSKPYLRLTPLSIDDDYAYGQIVRCPAHSPGLIVTVGSKSNGYIPPGPTYRWDSLAYEAIIDHNTTIVFVKGFNLRPGKVSNPSRYECVYGWDFSRPNYWLRAEVVSIAQEIVRCRTPLSVLNGAQKVTDDSIKVSVRVIGGRGGMIGSIARPARMLSFDLATRKQHEMCVCTMIRNQARFLTEWVVYHTRIGVQRWFIYDNNSDDEIDKVLQKLLNANYNISRHVWPWIKTQEAGFAHCALRAKDHCEWVGFIDVDEFFYLPSGLSLHNVLRNESRPIEVAELRTSCYNFGPSGLSGVPGRGVTVGYTCRLSAPERHKSIVRPETLNYTLVNVVHHFHLRDGFEHANIDKNVMVINHYKYQVWEVFKQKFYRRVSTYVADWQETENVGSKDRTPGLGTRAVEPPDWSRRFCEVTDNGLRDQVLSTFLDLETNMLPWQSQPDNEEEYRILVKPNMRRIA